MSVAPGPEATPPPEGGDTTSPRAAEESLCLLDWLRPAPGAWLGLVSDCECHPRSLAAYGYPIRRLDPGAWLAASPASPSGSEAWPMLDGLCFVDRTLWPDWEVEEIHRLRLRRAADTLRVGARLVFGARETLGRPEQEYARRLARALASAPAVAPPGAPPPSPRRGRFTHYTPAQAGRLLSQCGFVLERVRNDYADTPIYDHDRPGMIFVCRRI